MILEFKILFYWLFWVVIFGIASFIEYKTSKTKLWYRYYNYGYTGFFKFIFIIGAFILAIYFLFGFTNLWFKGEWIPLLES